MSNSLQHKMLWGGELLSAILVLLFILVVSACQNDAPKAAALRIHIIDGLSSSKTVMPDGFRGVDQYELVIADQSGFEIARSTATGSVDALVSGIVPGQYTITVNGYADIGSEPVLIINDSQPLTVKDGMTEVSVAVSGIAEGTGTVDLSITAEMPEGYMFADDAVTVRLYDGGEAVYTTTVGYTVTDGAMTARLEDDIEAGVYTAEVQVDELYGRVMLYALPGMRSTGTIAVNPMIAEKVATPVIEEEYNSEYQYEIGDTIMVDGIECLVGYDAQSEQEWGRYILIDKKHDLSYYTRGSDFYNDLYITDDINTCEWGELTAGNYYDIDSHWGQYPIIEGKQNTQAILQVIESNGVPDGDYLSIWDDLLVWKCLFC